MKPRRGRLSSAADQLLAVITSAPGLRQRTIVAQRGADVGRDRSRLALDASDATLVRDPVRDRGRRPYYMTGHDVQFANANDLAITFIQDTGH